MATIKARRQANGTIRCTAIVRKRVHKTIAHREAKTFTHRSAAVSWAKHREVELEDPAALARKQHAPVTVGELTRWYVDTFEPISTWQRSKQSHLGCLERHALGKLNALSLAAAALINHVRARRADDAGPATVMNGLIGIGVVVRVAKNVRGLPVRPEIVHEARSACGEARLLDTRSCVGVSPDGCNHTAGTLRCKVNPLRGNEQCTRRGTGRLRSTSPST
jgi:hypothetical protein